jgi:hypothetical protein
MNMTLFAQAGRAVACFEKGFAVAVQLGDSPGVREVVSYFATGAYKNDYEMFVICVGRASAEMAVKRGLVNPDMGGAGFAIDKTADEARKKATTAERAEVFAEQHFDEITRLARKA